jgi:hypothetical protein
MWAPGGEAILSEVSCCHPLSLSLLPLLIASVLTFCFSTLAQKLLFTFSMNSSGQLPISDSAARPLAKAKRGRPRKRVAAAKESAQSQREYAAAGTLTRTKSLLAAALRVWELKQRGIGR